MFTLWVKRPIWKEDFFTLVKADERWSSLVRQNLDPRIQHGPHLWEAARECCVHRVERFFESKRKLFLEMCCGNVSRSSLERLDSQAFIERGVPVEYCSS